MLVAKGKGLLQNKANKAKISFYQKHAADFRSRQFIWKVRLLQPQISQKKLKVKIVKNYHFYFMFSVAKYLKRHVLTWEPLFVAHALDIPQLQP